MKNPAPPLIARSHLLRRLQTALKTGHVFISAPPGYGKSTLLRLLAAQHPQSHLVGLDLNDADLAQLQARLRPVLRSGLTLLLDDVQYLDGADDAIGWLIEQARALPVRLVLGGRKIPGAARALGPVTAFSTPDLAFTRSECEALLGAGGLIPEPQSAGWYEHTRGWPLALALLAREPAGLARLEAAAGAAEPLGELLDYLADMLTGSLPPELQRFMVLTAVPLRFDDELAAALLGGTAATAAQLRGQVLARNLFLSEAGQDGWFRYHDLIREFLLTHLERFGEDRRARFEQAAEWFAAREDLPLAIEHALAGGLGGLAASLIARLPAEFVRNEGRYRSFRRWVLSLDQPTLALNPLLLERLGYELLDINWNEEAWRHLRAALQLAEAAANVPAQHRIRLTMAKAHRFEGRPRLALDICQALLSDPALPSDLRRRALNTAANSHVQLSQFSLARRAYYAVLETPEQAGTLPNAFFRANLASVALIPLGDFEAAQRLLAANDAYFADKPVGRSHHWLGWCALHEALGDWAALERDLRELDAAEAQAEQHDSNNVWSSWWWALLHIGQGHYTAARQALEQAQALVGPNPEEVICVGTARTWLLRREGRWQAAAEAAQAILDQSWESPLYRAVLALERDLAASSGDRPAALHPETLNVARLRARAQIMRLRAMLAVRCQRAGDPRWQRHARAVVSALGRPGYAGLLTRRDPDLAAQFWTACLQEDFALEPALAGLRALGTWEPLLPLLAHADGAVRARAARGLQALGREEAMPALAAALAAETQPAVARAIGAALEALEQAPPPTLRVQLMGDFVLRRGDRLIGPSDWQRPAVRRLFQYFVLHRGERLARDRILEDVWAGVEPAVARASFNQVFSWLRRLLEPAMRPRTASRYLTVEDDNYRFDPRRDPQVAMVDIEAFEATVRPVLSASDQQDLPLLPEALLTALAAWRPLLLEAPYEGWTLEPRERLLNLYVEGCLYAAQALLDRARPAEAAPWAARVVAEAPWREEGYQAQMRAQARVGNRSLALKTYAEAVAALERELNAAPSAATQWLGHRLQQGEDI